MKKNHRIKNAALSRPAPQTRDQCAEQINQIGRLQREILTLNAAMNDEIAAITDRYTGQYTPRQEEVKALSAGVQSYCEAHRNELTGNGKSKSGEFVTGTVQWRQQPPSVQVRGVDAVIEALLNLGLGRFVRTKNEVNKEAILNEPDAVKGVAGISLKTKVEAFVITPFEQEAA